MLGFLVKALVGNPSASGELGFEPVPSEDVKTGDSFLWNIFSTIVFPAAAVYLIQFLLFVGFASVGLIPPKLSSIISFVASFFGRN